MISLLNTCAPSQVFLVLFFMTLGLYSFYFYTEPINPYCIRRNSPDDCGENQRKYFAMNLFIIILFGLLWTWILNIICHIHSESLAWILVYLPYIIVAMILVFFTATMVGKVWNHPEENNQTIKCI